MAKPGGDAMIDLLWLSGSQVDTLPPLGRGQCVNL